MGGYGSGRESRGHKITVEAAQEASLPIAALRKAGALEAETTWKTTIADSYSSFVVSGRVQTRAGLWLRLENGPECFVRLEQQHKPFGGSVDWFVCPICTQPTGRLFALRGRWACRKCSKLCYASQLMDRKERFLHKVRALNRELGVKNWDDHFASPIFKPKGMHQTTWQRKLAEHRAAFDAWNNLSLGGMLAFINRVETRWGKTKA